MKRRAIVLVVFLFSISFVTLRARAGYTPPNSGQVRNNPLQNLAGGRDVAGSEWNSWQAPGTASTDPNGLIPSNDSTNLMGLSEHRLDSLFGTNATVAVSSGNTKVEIVKPIEKVEPRSESHTANVQAVVVVPRKSDAKRIALIAVACVGILAYRKFRRPQTVPWKKPNFL